MFILWIFINNSKPNIRTECEIKKVELIAHMTHYTSIRSGLDCQLKLHVIYFHNEYAPVFFSFYIFSLQNSSFYRAHFKLCVCVILRSKTATGQLGIKPQTSNPFKRYQINARLWCTFCKCFYYPASSSNQYGMTDSLLVVSEMNWTQKNVEINRLWFVEFECEFNNRMSYNFNENGLSNEFTQFKHTSGQYIKFIMQNPINSFIQYEISRFYYYLWWTRQITMIYCFYSCVFISFLSWACFGLMSTFGHSPCVLNQNIYISVNWWTAFCISSLSAICKLNYIELYHYFTSLNLIKFLRLLDDIRNVFRYIAFGVPKISTKIAKINTITKVSFWSIFCYAATSLVTVSV